MPEGTRKVLIVGATSAIAEAVARRLAVRGDSLLLAGRDAMRLNAIAADLGCAGPGKRMSAFSTSHAATSMCGSLTTPGAPMGRSTSF